MALATRCPHCKTTFRVAHDQLKLRSGLVRCGACKEIFNGVEHLLRPEEAQAVLGTPAASSPSPVVAPAPSQDVVKEHGSAEAVQQAEPSTESESGSQAPHADDSTIESQSEAASPAAISDHAAHVKRLSDIEDTANKEDPLQRMTLMDVTAFASPQRNETAAETTSDAESIAHGRSITQRPELAPDANDEISKAIDSLQNKPWRRKKHKGLSGSAEENDFSESVEAPEPDFVKHARRQKHYGRAIRLAMGIGTLVLFVILLAQALYTFRPLIAAHVPAARPALAFLCEIAQCRIGLPAQIERISIESSELKASPSSSDQLTLIALLRNQANTVQAWPNIELTLTDDEHKPVARKVLAPRDYLLSSQLAVQGFPAQSEQAIKVSFELSQIKASDYRLYLFYP